MGLLHVSLSLKNVDRNRSNYHLFLKHLLKIRCVVFGKNGSKELGLEVGGRSKGRARARLRVT